MMLGLASFAMSARWRAIVVATLCAAGAWVLPPLTSPLVYLGGAVIGLVTLRLGALQGLSLALVASAALGVMGVAGTGLVWPLVIGAWILWLPVWAFSVLLRSSRSLALSLQAVVATGLLLIVVAYAVLGQPAQWWAPRLDTLLGPAFAAQGLDTASYFPLLARWMTALSVAAVLFGALLSLLLARSWQAGLYNPGGFGAEFRDLRLGRSLAGMSLAMVLTATILNDGVAMLLADMTVVLLVVYLLQGLAVVHALVHIKQAHRGWLIGLYVVLLLAAPEMMPVVALLGWMDAWIDVRARLRTNV